MSNRYCSGAEFVLHLPIYAVYFALSVEECVRLAIENVNVQKARVYAQSSGVRNFVLFKLDLFGTIKNDLQSDVFECRCRIVRSVAASPGIASVFLFLRIPFQISILLVCSYKLPNFIVAILPIILYADYRVVLFLYKRYERQGGTGAMILQVLSTIQRKIGTAVVNTSDSSPGYL